jgi:hypothetical protein
LTSKIEKNFIKIDINAGAGGSDYIEFLKKLVYCKYNERII